MPNWREIENTANKLLGLKHSNSLLGCGSQYLFLEVSIGDNNVEEISDEQLDDLYIANQAARKGIDQKYAISAKAKTSRNKRQGTERYRAIRRKYAHTEKGLAARKKYAQSEKGRARNRENYYKRKQRKINEQRTQEQGITKQPTNANGKNA